MVIQLKDIHKSYSLGNRGSEKVLKGISLSFNPGEFFSIFGPSGCGKSTLLHILTGLDTDYEGSVIYSQVNLKTLSSNKLADFRRDNIGFVFQSFNLLPHLTVRDNLLTTAYLKTSTKIDNEKRINQVLSSLGILDLTDKNPNEISGGQKQRVAIARALMNEPQVIIADEPTGALDKSSQKNVLQILRSLADAGKTVIVVTHNPEVVNYSDRMVEIVDGTVIEEKEMKR